MFDWNLDYYNNDTWPLADNKSILWHIVRVTLKWGKDLYYRKCSFDHFEKENTIKWEKKFCYRKCSYDHFEKENNQMREEFLL